MEKSLHDVLLCKKISSVDTQSLILGGFIGFGAKHYCISYKSYRYIDLSTNVFGVHEPS